MLQYVLRQWRLRPSRFSPLCLRAHFPNLGCWLDSGAFCSHEVVNTISLKYWSERPLCRKLIHVVPDARIKVLSSILSVLSQLVMILSVSSHVWICCWCELMISCIFVRIVSGYLWIRHQSALLSLQNSVLLRFNLCAFWKFFCISTSS